MKRYLVAVVFLMGIAGIVGFVVWAFRLAPETRVETKKLPEASGVDRFSNSTKSAHFESNTPAHGTVLAGVPVNVVVDFNFDLAEPSEIKILKDGRDIGIGETSIDGNKLVMRRQMDIDSSDGLYTVEYKACWADGSCHDGNFQFAIDRGKAAQFVDMRGKKEVTVSLKNSAFAPQDLRVSFGAKVTWVNTDDIVHTVNTDSHPTHTYFLSQNSRNLNSGDVYSVTFEKTGLYPYHCTPHASFMTGSILVE